MNTKKRVWLLVAALLLLLAAGFGIGFVYARMNVQEDPDIYDRLQQAQFSAVPAPASSEAPPPVEIPVDFAYWQGVNPDVYAWIHIEGTEVDYPVLRSETDNTYYLNHNIDGSSGYPGCIYSENYNSADFTDPVTILYGHNMGHGEPMFHELHKFESTDFFKNHTEILVYLPDSILHYQVYSVYNYTDVHLMHAFDFSDEEQFQSFLDQCALPRDMHANVNSELEVTTQDRFLVLSTCNGIDTQRLLVVAVLQETEK